MATEKEGRVRRTKMRRAHELLRSIGFDGCQNNQELFLSARTLISLTAAEVNCVEDEEQLRHLIVAKIENVKEETERQLSRKIDALLQL